MFETGQLATYLIAITLLTITPGVDTLLVVRNAARGGWQDGVISSVGICSGLFIHAAISAVGISFILLQTAWLFSGLKLCGAGYLIWLGFSNLRTCMAPAASIRLSAAISNRALRPFRSLHEGFLSNVLNPKTVIFYMAFLPQFINSAYSPVKQALLLAALHFVVAMLWQSALALAVNRARVWLQRPRVLKLFSGLTGIVLVTLGVRLATEN